MPGTPSLDRIAALLAGQYPQEVGPPHQDPFALVLWEQVAYLATDAVRLRAFHALRDRIGLGPEAILAAPMKELTAIARIGGRIAVKERAERMRLSAELAPQLHDLGRLSAEEARKRLARFPMIGAPGADKILLASGLFPLFAVDSNGLRVLVRLGFGREGTSYAATYRSAMNAVDPVLPRGATARYALHQRLKLHGTTCCKRAAPKCDACTLRHHCSFGLSIQE